MLQAVLLGSEKRYNSLIINVNLLVQAHAAATVFNEKDFESLCTDEV